MSQSSVTVHKPTSLCGPLLQSAHIFALFMLHDVRSSGLHYLLRAVPETCPSLSQKVCLLAYLRGILCQKSRDTQVLFLMYLFKGFLRCPDGDHIVFWSHSALKIVQLGLHAFPSSSRVLPPVEKAFYFRVMPLVQQLECNVSVSFFQNK